MKKWLQKIGDKVAKINYVLLVFALISVFFALPAFNIKNTASTTAIVNALGIDQTDEGVDVTMVMFSPKLGQGFSENFIVSSASGKTILDALVRVSAQVGKKFLLSHTEVICVNDKLVEGDMIPVFNYLLKSYDVKKRTSLISTNESAKDLLGKAIELYQSTGMKLVDILHTNEDYDLGIDSNLTDFYGSNHLPTASFLLASINTDGEADKAGGAGKEGESGEGSGEKTETKPPVENKGEGYLMAGGKGVKKMSAEEVYHMHWLKAVHTVRGVLTVEAVTDGQFENATLDFLIQKDRTRTVLSWEEGKPKVKFVIPARVKLQGVQEPFDQNKQIFLQDFKLTPYIQQRINDQIEEQVFASLTILKENKADIIGMHNHFRRKTFWKWKQFRESLEGENDYLNQMEFEVEVRIRANV